MRMRQSFLATVVTATLALQGTGFAQNAGGAGGGAPNAGQGAMGAGQNVLPNGSGRGAEGGGTGAPHAEGGSVGQKPGLEPQAGHGMQGKGMQGQGMQGQAMQGQGMQGQPRQGGGDRRHPARIDRGHQERFRHAINGLGIRELQAVDFALNVGVRVPRALELNPLPPSIIDAYPDYEGYEFVLVRGDIVVVDPETLEIIDVFPA
ncbi:DUF1236 domain-containing protein [Lichenihabitans psoromatis]|uniref:DUF1236 domain-containing protein n=1 Tax=Lichenihabitans psoromatis TaxID=2528642 RepID=UPI0010383043|nr:DUF1236 domain-containing protein [Lichenihabitans psoromatis]